MADVDTWSPLDESNTAAPPDGWPEFMLPSGVNNSARAMMGAIRRWYDKTLSGELVLPYLKLSGGTVTGATTVSAAFTATAITSNTTIYSSSTISTGGGLSASGNINGANVTASATVQGAQLTSTGNINASGAISATGNITTGNTVQGGYVNSTGNLNAAGAISAGSNVTGGYIRSYGNMNVDTNLGVGGTVTAGGISSSGSVTAAYVSSSGDIQLNGTLRGNGVNLPIASHIYPSSDGGTYCGLSGSAWAGVESYAYYTKSDERLKTGIRDLPDCLDLVRQIQPKRYRLKDDTREHYGFIAREVGRIMGEDFAGYRAAKTDDERDALAYDELISVLWKAVQALDARLTEGGL